VRDTKSTFPDSVLGRLLREVSWDGSTVRRYRDGGVGFENVLTAEAMTALDFLPRTHFLGAVLAAAQGADSARQHVIAEIEEAQLTLLPDDIVLAPSRTKKSEQLIVQPDGIMISPGCYTLIEAKRIRSSSFQAQQLAREYVSVLHQARGRTPLLLLILGTEPPVRVQGHGKQTVAEAIERYLGPVLGGADEHAFELEPLLGGIPDVVAWLTWSRLGQVVDAQRALFKAEPSVRATVDRLADSVGLAISRHA
jgi:hypothetical protein